MTPESPGGEGRLKPCPFCGGTRAHVTTDFGFRAGCPDCHAQAGGSSSRTAAVSGWNRRPPSGDGVGLDAALRKLHDVAERDVLNPECGRDCDDDYVRVGCPVHCPIEPAPTTHGGPDHE